MNEDHLLHQVRPPRVAWVDVARVLTMLCTMLTHAPVVYALKRGMWFTGSGRMCLLFLVAGYFMGKSREGRSVYFPHTSRAFRMLWAYIILIALYVLFLGWTPYWTWQVLDPLLSGSIEEKFDVIERLFGIGDQPPGPFWFLRDLILLTLMCGGLVYLRNKGFLLLISLSLLCFGTELACNHFRIGVYQMIHPREIAFFSLGVCLSPIALSVIADFLNKRGIAILLLTVAVLIYEWNTRDHPSSLGIVFFMLSTCVVALGIERFLPAFSKWMAGLGQTVFLVYVLHMLFISLIWHLVRQWNHDPSAMLPEWSWFVIVPVMYLGIHYFGMLIKKLSPGLFALIAIRPPVKKAKDQ